MTKLLTSLLLAGMLSACGGLKKIPESQLIPGYYEFKQPGERFRKVYVDVDHDSVTIVSTNQNVAVANPNKQSTDQLFLKRSFDVDVLITPFKFRPSTANFPVQLNTDFNGNIFLGYRLDRFRVHFDKNPVRQTKKIHHRAMTVGAIGGFGTAFVSPWTTNYKTTDEYNAFILSRGFAAMVRFNNLTVGLGIGWDYITDRDKDIWIYQNQAWYGLTLSLNLN
jgi:hypothetical protein